jgi:hypothetical protein
MCVVYHFPALKSTIFVHQKYAFVVGFFGIFVVFFYVFVVLGCVTGHIDRYTTYGVLLNTEALDIVFK